MADLPSAMRKAYTSDLTDAQWALVEPLLPEARHRGRRRTVDLREIVNAALYIDRNGAAWRDLPHDFPAWQTAYAYFARWRDDGTWHCIYERLHRRLRQRQGREGAPSAVILDSQSVQASELAQERGHDRAKATKGRKRHLMVDTEGFAVSVVVTAASTNDKRGARLLLAQAPATVTQAWADAGYTSRALASEAAAQGIRFETSSRHSGGGFHVQARRWVVERTFAWLLRWRRLGRDVERLSRTVEALVYVAMTKLVLNRLAPS